MYTDLKIILFDYQNDDHYQYMTIIINKHPN